MGKFVRYLPDKKNFEPNNNAKMTEPIDTPFGQ